MEKRNGMQIYECNQKMNVSFTKQIFSSIGMDENKYDSKIHLFQKYALMFKHMLISSHLQSGQWTLYLSISVNSVKSMSLDIDPVGMCIQSDHIELIWEMNSIYIAEPTGINVPKIREEKRMIRMDFEWVFANLLLLLLNRVENRLFHVCNALYESLGMCELQ